MPYARVVLSEYNQHDSVLHMAAKPELSDTDGHLALVVKAGRRECGGVSENGEFGHATRT